MEEIEPAQRDMLYQLFTTLDVDKVNFLTPEQMKVAIRSQGFQPELPEDVEQFDFSTFCAQFKVTSRPKDQEDALKKMLTCLDSDFSGRISMKEVARVVKDQALCERVFMELGVQEDQTLGIDEFCARLFRM